MTEYTEEIERGGRIFKQVGRDQFRKATKDLESYRTFDNWPYEVRHMGSLGSMDRTCLGVQISKDAPEGDSYYLYYLRKDRL